MSTADQPQHRDDLAPQRASIAGPILHEAPWNGRLTRARAHVATVVVYRRGDHLVIWPHDRTRVLLHRRPATMYEIDLGLHCTVLAADLPSRGHEGSFHATISVHWRVFDPSAIVRHCVTDIEEALSAALLRQARSIARECGLDEVPAAEDKLNEHFRGVEIDVAAPAGIEEAMRKATDRHCLGAEYGLWTRVIVHLELDEAAIEHNAKMKRLEWAIQEEEAAHKLRLLQNSNQQEITARRMDIYRKIIAADDAERFALRLSQHPDEISAVTAIIREDQLTSRHETIDFISRMVESGVVERWEVSDQVREVLRWLTEATVRILGDNDRLETEGGQLPRQRRRGRGQPIEQRPGPEPPSEAAVITGQAIPVDEGGESGTSPAAPVAEANPAPEPD